MLTLTRWRRVPDPDWPSFREYRLIAHDGTELGTVVEGGERGYRWRYHVKGQRGGSSSTLASAKAEVERLTAER